MVRRLVWVGAMAALTWLTACGGSGGPPDAGPPDGAPGALAGTPPTSCPVSTPRPVTPDVAPGLGEHPFWLIAPAVVDAASLDDAPLKAVAVVYGDFGEAVVTGERLDGGPAALFSGFGASMSTAGPLRRLVLRPGVGEVTPGGRVAGPEYHYYAGGILYPEAGCWQITALVDGGAVRVVQYVAPP